MAGLLGNIGTSFNNAGVRFQENGGVNGLMSSPMFMSGMSLLGAGRDNRIDPYQAAMSGMGTASQFKTQQDQQAAIQKAQTLLGNGGSQQEVAAALLGSGNPSLMSQGAKMAAPSTSDAPSSVREWEYYNSLSEEQRKQYLSMKRANQYLDLGPNYVSPNPVTGQVDQVANKGLAPKDTPQHAAEIEGAKVTAKHDAETQSNQPKAAMKMDQTLSGIASTMQEVDRAIESVGMGTSGFLGSALSKVPGTPAYDLKQTALTVRANIGFDRLQAMRDASPTGGALGQVAVQELDALQAAVASMDQGQSADQLTRNLKKVKQHYENWQRIVEGNYDNTYGNPSPNTGNQELSDQQLLEMYGG